MEIVENRYWSIVINDNDEMMLFASAIKKLHAAEKMAGFKKIGLTIDEMDLITTIHETLHGEVSLDVHIDASHHANIKDTGME